MVSDKCGFSDLPLAGCVTLAMYLTSLSPSFFIDKMRTTDSTHLIKFCEIIYKEHSALHYAIVMLHSDGKHSKF